MADLAAARRAQTFDFTCAERREVVLVHEALVQVRADVVELLLVAGRAQGEHTQNLRLAAGEQAGAVRSRQDSGVARDGTNLGQAAAIDAQLAFEDGVANNALLNLAEDRGQLLVSQLAGLDARAKGVAQ